MVIYKSKEKGVKWEINAGKYYHNGEYYPLISILPTLQFNRTFTPYFCEDEDTDYHTSLNFGWIIWYISIDKYWGDVWKKNIQ